MAVLIAVASLVVVVALYFTVYGDQSLGGGVQSFALNVLPNLASSAILFLSAYILFRRIQAKRSEVDKQELASSVVEAIGQQIAADFRHMETSLTDAWEYEQWGRGARSLGIGAIAPRWTDLSRFEGPLGRHFRNRLETATAPATWYIITMNPEAFSGEAELALMKAALRRGIDIKWAYHIPQFVEDDLALQIQWKFNNSRRNDISDRASTATLSSHLQPAVDRVEEGVQQARVDRQRLHPEEARRCGTWEVYHSRAVSFYLAWLAVAGDCLDTVSRSAPGYVFGFVHPYLFFPDSHEARAAFYFDTERYPTDGPRTILNYYCQSTIAFFRQGVSENYLELAPTSITEAAAATSQ